MGGIGLRDHNFNKYFIKKLGWGLSLMFFRSRSFLGKYESGRDIISRVSSTFNYSEVWRRIMNTWTWVMKGGRWNVYNRRSIFLFIYVWLPSGHIIGDHALQSILEILLIIHVR